MWMDLESIMLNEIRQRKTNTIHLIICEIHKTKQTKIKTKLTGDCDWVGTEES